MNNLLRVVRYTANLKRVLVAGSVMLMSILAFTAPSLLDKPTVAVAAVPKQAATKPPTAVPACPDLVKQASNKVNGECRNTGRNKICYGNINMSSQLQEGVSDVKFANPGDITDLKNIKTLKLSGLDPTTGDWGIALLRVQANLPDTSPGQNVTMLMFGDVELIDSSASTTDLAATNVLSTRTAFAPTVDAADTMLAPTQFAANTVAAATNQYYQTRQYATVNARATNADATLLARSTNQDATALFKSANQDATAVVKVASQNPTQQLRSTNTFGTAIAKATNVDATAQAKGTNQDATAFVRATSQLQTRDARATTQQDAQNAAATKSYQTLSAPLPLPLYRSMQAFYFRTGVGDTACAEAPKDGILIQSPGGKQTIKLAVDEAIIELGSTVFMTAQPGGKMAIYTLEGSAGVTSFGQTEVALAGMVVRTPIDSNLRVSGPPEKPEAYDLSDLQGLPLKLLPKVIKPSDPREYTGTGSMVSGELGEACLTGGVAGGNSTDGSDPYVVAVPVGGAWSAKAGTTATFKVTGSLLVQGVWKNYIALAPAGAGLAGPVEASAFAVSGGSTELTYTFTKDNPRFYVDVGITTVGGVNLTVTCSTLAPTPTVTPSGTASGTSGANPSPTVTPSPSLTPTK